MNVLAPTEPALLMWRHHERRLRELESQLDVLAEMINDLYVRMGTRGIPKEIRTEEWHIKNRAHQAAFRERRKALLTKLMADAR